MVHYLSTDPSETCELLGNLLENSENLSDEGAIALVQQDITEYDKNGGVWIMGTGFFPKLNATRVTTTLQLLSYQVAMASMGGYKCQFLPYAQRLVNMLSNSNKPAAAVIAAVANGASPDKVAAVAVAVGLPAKEAESIKTAVASAAGVVPKAPAMPQKKTAFVPLLSPMALAIQKKSSGLRVTPGSLRVTPVSKVVVASRPSPARKRRSPSPARKTKRRSSSSRRKNCSSGSRRNAKTGRCKKY